MRAVKCEEEAGTYGLSVPIQPGGVVGTPQAGPGPWRPIVTARAFLSRVWSAF